MLHNHELKALMIEKVDVLVITETKLEDETLYSNLFSINSFSQPIRLDRNRNRVGIIIYVTEDISIAELRFANLPLDIAELKFANLNLRTYLSI